MARQAGGYLLQHLRHGSGGDRGCLHASCDASAFRRYGFRLIGTPAATLPFWRRHTPEEAQVDFLAGLLGYQKVGWIFSQSKQERDFIMHTGELLQVAAMQVGGGGEGCKGVGCGVAARR